MLSSDATLTSDHPAIANVISEFDRQHPKSYNECVEAMGKIMETHFPALFHKTSPIQNNLEKWDAEDVAFLLLEYASWTSETIHMFLDARIRVYWDSVRKEIERNVGEEMGDLIAGVPHLELMRQSFSKELGVDADKPECSAITEDFIGKMRQIFKHKDNAYTAGALLAFETVATEEFKIVGSFLRRRKALLGGEVSKNSLTDLYISAHVDHEEEGDHPEDSHYEGLLLAIEPHINESNIHKFVKGFFSICVNLNMWWERLAVETYYLKVERENLLVTDPETVEIDGILKMKSAHS